MSCFADLGSCQSCKSQEQCKKTRISILSLSDLYSTILHHLSPILHHAWQLTNCPLSNSSGRWWSLGSLEPLAVESSEPSDPLRFKVAGIASTSWRYGKMLKKTWKERNHLDHLAVVFQKKTCSWSWIEIDFVDTSSPTQFNNTVCFSSDWRHWEILQNPGQTEYFGTSLRKETKTGQKMGKRWEDAAETTLLEKAQLPYAGGIHALTNTTPYQKPTNTKQFLLTTSHHNIFQHPDLKQKNAHSEWWLQDSYLVLAFHPGIWPWPFLQEREEMLSGRPAPPPHPEK